MEMVNSNGEEVDKEDVVIETRDGSLRARARWCWLRRTTLERALLVLLLITLIALIISMVFAIINSRVQEQSYSRIIDVSNSAVCADDNCVSIASELISNMDLLVDPCDDFYEYSCGNWLRHNPDNTIQLTVAEEIFKVCKGLLNVGPTAENTDGAIWKSKTFYASCMNREHIETNGARQLLEFLNDFGGFHTEDVPCQEDETRDSFTKHLAELMLASDRPLLVRLVPSGRDIRIGQTTKTMICGPSGQMESEKNFIMETLAALYPTQSGDTLRIATNVSELSMRLQNACTNDTDDSEVVAVADLQRMIPQINWVSLFRATLPAGSYDPNANIFLHHGEYFKKLSIILNDTSIRVVKEYCLWHVIKFILPYTEGSLREISQRYQKTPRISDHDRAKYCTEMTLKHLEDAVAAMFIEDWFNTSMIDQANNIYTHIKETYRSMVNATDDIDEESKTNILQLIDLTTVEMAYPEYMFDRVQLDETYHKLQIDDNFLTNVLALRQHTTLKPWSVQMTGTNIIYPRFSALYNHKSHTILIPLGSLLRPSLAQYDFRSVLYSGVGISMAHELAHSLDYLIDKRLPLEDKKITVESEDVIQQRLDCLLSSLEDDIDANGDIRSDDVTQYQNEARADLVGLEVAYQAFKKHQGTRILPYLNVNADQTFFINFAQMMCGHMDDMQIIRGVHPPNKYRVFTSLRNLGEFAAAFNCSPDSPMNPSKKCTMWHHVPIDDN